MAETVTITKAEYESLQRESLWLACLESAGVDNWHGYEYAMDMFQEEGGMDEE